MDSARSLAATTAAAPVPGAPAARPQADATGDASTFFANLLQKVSNQFSFTTAGLVDPATIPTIVAQAENRPPDPRDDQAAQAKDDAADSAADKKNAAADDKTASTKTSTKDTAKTDTASTAPATTDPNLSAQLSALQALLLTQQQTATPVVTTAPVIVAQAAATPDVVAPVAPTTAPVVDPTAPVAANPAATPVAPVQATTPVTPQQMLAAQVQAAATVVQAPVATQTAAPTTKAASTQPELLTTQPQTQDTTDATTAPTTTTQAALPQTAKAQSQSDAMSKLLGDTNAIRVTVTVDPQTAATPTVDVYDHFAGYSMGDNATTSLANGQFGSQTATNALVADPAGTAPTPNLLTQASVAAAQAPALPATAATTATPAARTDTITAGAVTSVASNSASAESQSGLGQMGLGQPGPGNSNATTATTASSTTQPTTTPAQVFEQIKVKITRATKAGLDEVSIHLKPEDLGRVDIKLQVSPDGKVHATVTADKPDTLAMLQHDAQGLERALNDAGLKADAGNLQFNLRGDGNASSGSQFANGSGSQTTGGAAADENATAGTFDYASAAVQRGGVDTYA